MQLPQISLFVAVVALAAVSVLGHDESLLLDEAQSLSRELMKHEGVNQEELESFSREINHIKEKLQKEITTLEKKDKTLKAKIAEVQKKIAKDKKDITHIKSRIADLKRKAVVEAEKKFQVAKAALAKKIAMHKKGLEFVRALKRQVDSLNEHASNDEYDLQMADIRQQLLQTSEAWSDVADIDVRGELAAMDEGSSAIIMSSEDLDEDPSEKKTEQTSEEKKTEEKKTDKKKKLYEKTKLTELVGKMEKSLIAAKKHAEEALKRAKEGKPSPHLRRLMDALKVKEGHLIKLQAALRKLNSAYTSEHGSLPAALKAFKRELSKLNEIESRLYKKDRIADSYNKKSNVVSSDDKKASKKKEVKSGLMTLKSRYEDAQKRLKSRVKNMKGYSAAAKTFSAAHGRYKQALAALKKKLCAAAAELKRRILSSPVYKQAIKVGRAVKARYMAAKRTIQGKAKGRTLHDALAALKTKVRLSKMYAVGTKLAATVRQAWATGKQRLRTAYYRAKSRLRQEILSNKSVQSAVNFGRKARSFYKRSSARLDNAYGASRSDLIGALTFLKGELNVKDGNGVESNDELSKTPNFDEEKKQEKIKLPDYASKFIKDEGKKLEALNKNKSANSTSTGNNAALKAEKKLAKEVKTEMKEMKKEIKDGLQNKTATPANANLHQLAKALSSSATRAIRSKVLLSPAEDASRLVLSRAHAALGKHVQMIGNFISSSADALRQAGARISGIPIRVETHDDDDEHEAVHVHDADHLYDGDDDEDEDEVHHIHIHPIVIAAGPEAHVDSLEYHHSPRVEAAVEHLRRLHELAEDHASDAEQELSERLHGLLSKIHSRLSSNGEEEEDHEGDEDENDGEEQEEEEEEQRRREEEEEEERERLQEEEDNEHVPDNEGEQVAAIVGGHQYIPVSGGDDDRYADHRIIHNFFSNGGSYGNPNAMHHLIYNMGRLARGVVRRASRRTRAVAKSTAGEVRGAIEELMGHLDEDEEDEKKQMDEDSDEEDEDINGLKSEEEHEEEEDEIRRDAHREREGAENVEEDLERKEQRAAFRNLAKDEKHGEESLKKKINHMDEEEEEDARVHRERAQIRRKFNNLEEKKQFHSLDRRIRRGANAEDTEREEADAIKKQMRRQNNNRSERREIRRMEKRMSRETSNKRQERRELNRLESGFSHEEHDMKSAERRRNSKMNRKWRRFADKGKESAEFNSIKKLERRESKAGRNARRFREEEEAVQKGFEKERRSTRRNAGKAAKKINKFEDEEQQQNEFRRLDRAEKKGSKRATRALDGEQQTLEYDLNKSEDREALANKFHDIVDSISRLGAQQQ